MKKYLVLLLIVICSFGFSKTEAVKPVDFEVNLESGEVFPAFVLESLNGKKELSTDKFKKNKKTMIVIAAEWCPDCQRELPEVEKFYQKNKQKYNMAVIFINVRSSEMRAQAYMDAYGYGFPAYYDYSGKVLEGTGTDAVPTNIFLDANGKISDVVIGTMNESEIAEKLK